MGKQEVPEVMVPASVVEKLRADMELMRKEVERLKRQNSSVEVSEPSSTDDSDESSNDGSLKPRRPLAKLRFRVSSRDDGIATSQSTDTLLLSPWQHHHWERTIRTRRSTASTRTTSRDYDQPWSRSATTMR